MAKRREEPVRNDPFAEFDRMFDDMRRRMDDLMQSATDQWSWDEPTAYSEVRYVEAPSARTPISIQEGEFRLLPEAKEAQEDEGALVDIMEKDNNVIVLAEMPCATKENLTASVKGKKLQLTMDAASGMTERVIALPSEVKPTSIAIECRNGVVMVTLQKRAARKPRPRKPAGT